MKFEQMFGFLSTGAVRMELCIRLLAVVLAAVLLATQVVTLVVTVVALAEQAQSVGRPIFSSNA